MYVDRPAMSLKVLGREARCRRLQNLASQIAGTSKICLCHAFQTTKTLFTCQRHPSHGKMMFLSSIRMSPLRASSCISFRLSRNTLHTSRPQEAVHPTPWARVPIPNWPLSDRFYAPLINHTRASPHLPSTVPNIGASKASKRDERTHPPASLGAF